MNIAAGSSRSARTSVRPTTSTAQSLRRAWRAPPRSSAPRPSGSWASALPLRRVGRLDLLVDPELRRPTAAGASCPPACPRSFAAAREIWVTRVAPTSEIAIMTNPPARNTSPSGRWIRSSAISTPTKKQPFWVIRISTPLSPALVRAPSLITRAITSSGSRLARPQAGVPTASRRRPSARRGWCRSRSGRTRRAGPVRRSPGAGQRRRMPPQPDYRVPERRHQRGHRARAPWRSKASSSTPRSGHGKASRQATTSSVPTMPLTSQRRCLRAYGHSRRQGVSDALAHRALPPRRRRACRLDAVRKPNTRSAHEDPTAF